VDNRVTCLNCGVTIVSRHRHDFVRCRCNDDNYAVFVDGGDAYQKRAYGPKARWVESDGTQCTGGNPTGTVPSDGE
jgi:hypothetical protein